MNQVELIVIGAGPAGLSVAAECAYHGLNDVLVLEKGDTHNQTVHQYYPDEKRVDAAYHGVEAICAGVLCFRDTTKANFLKIVDHLLETFSFRIDFGKSVDSIRRLDAGGFSVSTTDGESYQSRFVAVAIGRMGKPNRPEYFDTIPTEAKKRVQFDTRGLEPAGKPVLVIGGGNSAIEFALSLAPKARVTVSYRRETFNRLNPMNLAILEKDEREGRIRVLRNSHVAAMSERDGAPYVRFQDGSEELFGHVVFGIGGSSPAGFLAGAGIALDPKGIPHLSASLESSVGNLYVAGELSVPPGKGSIIASFNSGKTIAHAILDRLGRPRAPEIVRVPPRDSLG